MESMFGLAGFLERYGWYCLLAGVVMFALYQKFMYDRLQQYQEDYATAQRKKDGGWPAFWSC